TAERTLHRVSGNRRFYSRRISVFHSSSSLNSQRRLTVRRGNNSSSPSDSAVFLRVQSSSAFSTMPRVATLSQIVSYADAHLRIREIEDWPNALNGLQVENSGTVTKIGAAVDASLRTVRSASEHGVNFLSVHHCLFWRG